jgi:hypothetical protein
VVAGLPDARERTPQPDPEAGRRIRGGAEAVRQRHQQLRRKSAMIVAGLDRINTIVTDDGARSEELEDFRAAGIKVIVARVMPEDELKKIA